MEVKGVDLSYCQKGIDYKKLAESGVKFAIIRAGYSEASDKLLKTHADGCTAAGIDVGYYWYSYARNVKQAQREAAACLKAVAGFPKPKYPIFFDAEESAAAEAAGRVQMTDMALAFIAEIEKGGYPCGLYVNPSWMENYYEKQRLLTVDIWLAHWTGSPSKPSRFDYGQVVWQWGNEDVGSVIADGDVCFIDYPARTAEWYARNGGSGVGAAGDNAAVVKRLDEIALEVIRGKWGNGAERKRRLAAAGFDYIKVQSRVNEMLVR